MYIKAFDNHKYEYSIILAGVVIIGLILYPYWIFQGYSAMGWYDEYHAIIPWYYAKALNAGASVYLPGYAGGTAESLGYVFGNEHLSLYRLISSNLEQWQAQFVFRYFGMLVLFCGTYIFLRKVINGNILVSASCALFATLVTNIPYGWALGGSGWDLGAVVWFCVALFGTYKNIIHQIFVTLIISFIVSVTCAPIFLFPFTLFVIFGCILFIPDRCKMDKKLWLLLVLIWVPSIINWYDAQHSILAAKEFSARIQGTLTADAISSEQSGLLGSIFRIIKDDLTIIDYFFSRTPNQVLLLGYLILAIIAITAKKIKSTLLFVLYVLFIPVAADIIAKVSGVELFSRYRWTILFDMHSILFSFMYARLLTTSGELLTKDNALSRMLPKLNYRTYSNFAPIILIALSFVSGFKLANITLINLAADGGVGVTTHYKLLSDLRDTKSRERFISASYEVVGVIPIFYGLDTFDGMLTNFPYRRNYFIAYGIHEPSKDTLHTHRHFFSGFPANYNMDAIKMANVRYVISSKEINHPELVEIGSSAGVAANDIDYLLKPIVGEHFSEQKLVNKLFVYKIPDTWPRVFSPHAITISEYSYRDKAFYSEVKNLKKNTIVISKDDYSEDIKTNWKNIKPLTIENYRYTDAGMIVDITGKGIVVVNHVYTNQWSVSCSGENLVLVPVNGIMMATMVSDDCSQLIYTHKV